MPTPPAFDAPEEGLRRNIAMAFDAEKLEWCVYPVVKEFENIFTRFDRIHERDRQTDRHRMTA